MGNPKMLALISIILFNIVIADTGLSTAEVSKDSAKNLQRLPSTLSVFTLPVTVADFSAKDSAEVGKIKDCVDTQLSAGNVSGVSVDVDRDISSNHDLGNYVGISLSGFDAATISGLKTDAAGSSFQSTLSNCITGDTAGTAVTYSAPSVVSAIVGTEMTLKEWKDTYHTAKIEAECSRHHRDSGYKSGDALNVDYDATHLGIDNGETYLQLSVSVPRALHDQLDKSTFAITMHDRNTATSIKSACYTNRLNYDECPTADASWANTRYSGDNKCFEHYNNRYKLTDVTAKNGAGLFRTITTREDGSDLVVYITIDFESWNPSLSRSTTGGGGRARGGSARTYNKKEKACVAGHSIQLVQGKSVAECQALCDAKPGCEAFEFGNDHGGSGQYVDGDCHMKSSSDPDNCDGGHYNTDLYTPAGDSQGVEAKGIFDPNKDDAHDSLTLNAIRYDFYQSVLKLVFPQQVAVTATLSSGTMLNVIAINSKVEVNTQHTDPSNPLATIDVQITTNVGYPYAIKSSQGTDTNANNLRPRLALQDDSEITALTSAQGNYVSSTSENKCSTNKPGDRCVQEHVYRLYATGCNPSTKIVFDVWVVCANSLGQLKPGCPIDDLASNSDLDERRKSNSYSTFTVNVAPGKLCPTVADEISVSADFRFYTDENFRNEVSWSDTDKKYSGLHSNDRIYGVVNYSTHAASNGGTDHSNENLIDLVRPTRITMSVTSSLDDQDWAKTHGDTTELLINNADRDDIVGDFTNGKWTGSGNLNYDVVLCGLNTKLLTSKVGDSYENNVENSDVQTDCRHDIHGTAIELLNFEYITTLDVDSAELHNERSIQFGLRLDERIVPIDARRGGSTFNAANDGANVLFEVKAEVYYKGNRHPSRRRLLAEPSAPRKSVDSIISSPTLIIGPQEISTPTLQCQLDETDRMPHDMTLWLMTDETNMPTKRTVTDWSTNFEFHLGKLLGMQNWNQVSVTEVYTCKSAKECEVIMNGNNHRRLMGGKYMKVTFTIFSKQRTASFYTQRLQEMVIDPSSSLYELESFKKATIKNMRVPQCSKSTFIGSTQSRLDSAAAGFSLFGLFVAVFTALW